MGNRSDWANAFLARLGVPQSPGNVLGVVTWITSEFGEQSPIGAAFNPLATTYGMPNDSQFNSVGVKNYASWEDGVEANARTLSEDHPGYAEILGAMASDAGAVTIINHVHDSVWGSKPTPELLQTVSTNFAHYAGLEVGSGGSSSPIPSEPSSGVGRIAMPTLQQGSTGREVSIVQALVGAAIDGQFGPETDGKVREAQSQLGIAVDGVVGPQTWTALVQRAVGAAVDGVYGPETTAKVTEYQQAHGLGVDGIAGPETFGAISGQ
jgi:murein L,D-transpeptidase YcbB/YkuD